VRAGVKEGTEYGLVQAASHGDRHAIRVLVERYRKEVMRLCYRYTRDMDEAEDITQQAFIKALNSLESLRSPASFRPWLLRIASNSARNRLKTMAREVPLESSDITGKGSSPQEELMAREKQRELLNAITSLPPKQRDVVELRAILELPFRDVAKTLDISENSAKVNYHLAIKRLGSMLVKARAKKKNQGQGE